MAKCNVQHPSYRKVLCEAEGQHQGAHRGRIRTYWIHWEGGAQKKVQERPVQQPIRQPVAPSGFWDFVEMMTRHAMRRHRREDCGKRKVYGEEGRRNA